MVSIARHPGEQREAAGQDAAGDLDDEERHDEPEHDDEPVPASPAGRQVWLLGVGEAAASASAIGVSLGSAAADQPQGVEGQQGGEEHGRHDRAEDPDVPGRARRSGIRRARAASSVDPVPTVAAAGPCRLVLRTTVSARTPGSAAAGVSGGWAADREPGAGCCAAGRRWRLCRP